MARLFRAKLVGLLSFAALCQFGGCALLQEAVCDVVSVEEADTQDLFGELLDRGFTELFDEG